MLLRPLFLVLFFGALFFLICKAILNAIAKFLPKENNKSANTTNTQQKFVRCATCDLHIPESEAIKNNSQFFCCNEHVN